MIVLGIHLMVVFAKIQSVLLALKEKVVQYLYKFYWKVIVQNKYNTSISSTRV